MSNNNHTKDLVKEWSDNPRWQGVVRPYYPDEVLKLQGSLKIVTL